MFTLTLTTICYHSINLITYILQVIIFLLWKSFSVLVPVYFWIWTHQFSFQFLLWKNLSSCELITLILVWLLVLVHESITDLGLFTILWHYLLDHGLDPVTDTHTCTKFWKMYSNTWIWHFWSNYLIIFWCQNSLSTCVEDWYSLLLWYSVTCESGFFCSVMW